MGELSTRDPASIRPAENNPCPRPSRWFAKNDN